MKALFFSFEGRIGRKTWWLATLGLIGVLLVLQLLVMGAAAVSPDLGMIVGLVAILLSLACLVPALALPIKRWHDVGKPGWWMLLGFIPVVNLYALYMTGFVKGDDGPNAYGADPLA